MILGKQEILKYLHNGELKIEPLVLENIGPASIDLTLGSEFVFLDKNKDVDISAQGIRYNNSLKKVDQNEIELKPGDFILGITKERITLPTSLAGWLQGRSSLARAGLAVHITASFIQPGSDNKQVLEIVNVGNSKITLHSGTKICQLILEEVRGGEKYKGKFKNQRKPTLS